MFCYGVEIDHHVSVVTCRNESLLIHVDGLSTIAQHSIYIQNDDLKNKTVEHKLGVLLRYSFFLWPFVACS